MVTGNHADRSSQFHYSPCPKVSGEFGILASTRAQLLRLPTWIYYSFGSNARDACLPKSHLEQTVVGEGDEMGMVVLNTLS
jgi:hypothetical protein